MGVLVHGGGFTLHTNRSATARKGSMHWSLPCDIACASWSVADEINWMHMSVDQGKMPRLSAGSAVNHSNQVWNGGILSFDIDEVLWLRRWCELPDEDSKSADNNPLSLLPPQQELLLQLTSYFAYDYSFSFVKALKQIQDRDLKTPTFPMATKLIQQHEWVKSSAIN